MFCRNDSLTFLKTTWLYDPSSLLYPKYSPNHGCLFIYPVLNSPFCFCAFLHVLTIKIFGGKIVLSAVWKSRMLTSQFYYDFDNLLNPNSEYTPLPITHSLMNSGLVASGALLFAFVITANHHTTIPSRWPHLLPRPNWIASFYDCIPKHIFVHLFVYIRKLLLFFVNSTA